MAITASSFDNWVYASEFGLDSVDTIEADATTITITTTKGVTVTLTGKFSNTGNGGENPEDIAGTITQIAWTGTTEVEDNTIAGLKVDAAQLVNLIVTSEGLGWNSEAFEDRLNSLIYKGNDHIVGDATHYNYIFGGAGNDKLVGGDAGNSFRAFDGNDNITGGDGEDYVYTGNGNSKITTDGGDDFVSVGNGNNNIKTGDGYDQVYAGGGNNTVDLGEGYNGFYASMTSSSSYDDHAATDGTVVNGTVTTTTDASSYNYVYAYASGNNKITSGDDSDHIFIGGGNNKIDAGNGHNDIWTTESVTYGEDYQAVTTTDGEDSITTENWLGTYTIQYGDGNNKVTVGDDNDYIQLGAGNNHVDLGEGFNRLYSQESYTLTYSESWENDARTETSRSYLMQYGDGNNKVTGGDGEDYIIVGDGNNHLKLGDGYNIAYAIDSISSDWTYEYTDPDSVSVDDSYAYNRVYTGEIQYGGGNNNITGGAENDYVVVGSGNNNVKLGDGDNMFAARDTASFEYHGFYDSLAGYSDTGYSSTTSFGDGNNRVTGGDGEDMIAVGSGDNVIKLGDGYNSVYALDSVTYGEDYLDNTESWNYQFGDGNNKITGGDGEDFVAVGSGDNVIKLGDGYNSVYAMESATVTAYGEDADFSISFGDGNNKITGGNDGDFVVVGSGDNVIKLGDGVNVVYAVDSVEGSISGYYGGFDLFDSGYSLSELLYDDENDVNYSDGGNNKITGGKDSDYVFVGSGDDHIQLGKGADGVDAGAGSNKIDLGKSDGDIDWVDFNYNDFLTTAAEGGTAFNKVTGFGAEDELWFELDIDTSEVLIQNGKIDLSNASNDGYVLALDTSSGKLYYDADGSGSESEFVQIGLIQGAGVKGLTSANVFDDGDWIAIGNVSFT